MSPGPLDHTIPVPCTHSRYQEHLSLFPFVPLLCLTGYGLQLQTLLSFVHTYKDTETHNQKASQLQMGCHVSTCYPGGRQQFPPNLPPYFCTGHLQLLSLHATSGPSDACDLLWPKRAIQCRYQAKKSCIRTPAASLSSQDVPCQTQ